VVLHRPFLRVLPSFIDTLPFDNPNAPVYIDTKYQ